MIAILLGACGPRANCDYCGMAQVFRNATAQAVTLAPSSPPVTVRPGERVTLNFSVPRQGGLGVLTETFRFVDQSGNTIFCRRFTYRELVKAIEIAIVDGVNECD